MQPDASFGVILPAAGTASRYGGPDKLLEPLAGRSVLQRALSLFTSQNNVSHIILVTAQEKISTYRHHLSLDPAQSKIENQKSKITFIPGGNQRWQSVLNGLRHLAALAASPKFVAIHDAARPLCPQSVIEEAFKTTREKGAALPCLPEPATLKRRGSDGTVAETVDRAALFQAQTPQCFTLADLLSGYEKLVRDNRTADLTDDAQVYERIGLPVPITQGSPLNLKITLAQDLELASALLKS